MEDNNIKRPLLLFAGVFVLGEVLTLLHAVVLAGVLAVCAAGYLCWRGKKTGSRAWMLLVFFFAVGCVRTGMVMAELDHEEAYGLGGMSARVTGCVESIQEKERWTVLVLRECRMETDERGASMKLLGLQVYLPKTEKSVKIGMQVQAEGECTAMEAARNPGQWDERMYYRGQKISYRMFADTMTIVKREYHPVYDGLYRLRRYFFHVLLQTAEPEDAGLFAAVLLGERQELDAEIYELYQENGIGHLLAISGLHLTLIGAALYKLLRKCGCSFPVAAVFGGIFVCAYAVMTGGSVSARRASMMLMLCFLAACPGRTYDMLSGIGLAALVILMDNPYQLLQSGFQFSFAAVLGISGIYPVLDIRFREAPVPARALLAGVSIQLVMLPVLLYHNFEFSPYSLILNLAAVPLMTYVVLSGVTGMLLGTFSPYAARIAFGTGHVIIRFYELMCRAARRLPCSVVVTGRPEVWQLAGYAGMLMVMLWWMGRGAATRKEKRNSVCLRGIFDRYAGAVLIFFCLVSPVLLHVPPQTGLRLTFLDVGQGDGICIQAGGKTALVDGGSTDEKDLGEYRLEPFLKSRGVTVVEHAFVSHGDEDHISGLRYLLGQESSMRIKNLYLPAAGQEDEAYPELVELANTSGCEVHWMKAGDLCRMGGMELLCVFPGETDRFDDRNAQSEVLSASYGEFHFLLTGDTGQEQEAKMLGREAVRRKIADTWLLKLAHHGSRYSSSEEWLDVVTPKLAVVSYGEGNSYGHPHQEVRKRLGERGIPVLETGRSGAIMFWTDGEKVRWETWLGD